MRITLTTLVKQYSSSGFLKQGIVCVCEHGRIFGISVKQG